MSKFTPHFSAVNPPFSENIELVFYLAARLNCLQAALSSLLRLPLCEQNIPSDQVCPESGPVSLRPFLRGLSFFARRALMPF